MNQHNITSHHPGAYNSKLWDYFDEIKAMVKARKTWPAIAEELNQKHQVGRHFTTIRNFWFRNQARTKPLPARLRQLDDRKPTIKLRRIAVSEQQPPLEVI